MKKVLWNILLLFIFVLGLLILLYPTLSDYWNSKIQSRAIMGYKKTLENIGEDSLLSYFEEADLYNQTLKNQLVPMLNYEQVEGYEKLLAIEEAGLIGYIKIEKINLELPIYKGTSPSVLSLGVGHMEGTSIPVGGLGTHSGLTAHRGLPSSKLFSHLDRLYEKDIFVLHILNKELTYEIDQIKVVMPNDISYLNIEDDKDLCTLVTCTPYGINTHRLLVRGFRIDNIEGKKDMDITIVPEAYKLDSFFLIIFFSAIMFIGLFILFLIKNREKEK